MQRFVFLALGASVALFGAVVPVEASLSLNRETNAQLSARGLLPPNQDRRSLTKTARQATTTGRLQVRSPDGSILGNVYNYPVTPHGINPQSDDGNPALDLFVEVLGSSLVALNASFPWPPFIGGSAGGNLYPRTTNTAQFRNVAAGLASNGQSDIWTLDSTSGELTAMWQNDQGSDPVSLVYDTELNMLYFSPNAGAITSGTMIEVNMFLIP